VSEPDSDEGKLDLAGLFVKLGAAFVTLGAVFVTLGAVLDTLGKVSVAVYGLSLWLLVGFRRGLATLTAGLMGVILSPLFDLRFSFSTWVGGAVARAVVRWVTSCCSRCFLLV